MRPPSLYGVLLVASLLASCTSTPDYLTVDLRTDLLPGLEFTSVHTELLPHLGAEPVVSGRGAEAIPVVRGDDYLSGLRVAEFDGLAASVYQLRVEVRDLSDNVVASRRLLVQVSGRVGVTAVITRDCVGLTCPGPTDGETFTECVGARCVPPDCSPESPTSCGATACEVSSDCAAGSVSCLSPLCTGGTCFYAARDDRCSTSEYCHPIFDCLTRPGASDAGPADAGSDASVDGGPAGADGGGPCGECTPNETRQGGCAQCLQQRCGSDCRWGRCQPVGECGSATECVCCDAGGEFGWRCCNMATCDFFPCSPVGACGAGCC